MKSNMRRRFLSLLLVLMMIVTALPAYALAEETKTDGDTTGVSVDIHVRTADDMVHLATNCQVESYSKGLVVSLDADVDLGNIGFMPIPSFSGTFLGNGHTISNFSCASNGSHQGLFRYVRSNGSVINLKVKGSVSPSGTRCAVGGIVGTNYGFIGNCQFDGTVSGLLNTGCIAGENYGIVKDCISSGKVTGKHFVGGIVGYNEGSIGYCGNTAAVNNEVYDEGITLSSIGDTFNVSNLEGLDISNILGIDSVADTAIDTVSDVGGVTGINTGIVKSCQNSGVVGYQHYGYNVGGIVGRQSGYTCDCFNSGEVYGRKDVGGVVGQMAPFMILESSSSVSEELDALQSSTNSALSNLDSNSAVLGDSLADTTVYGIAISNNYYDTDTFIEKALAGEKLTKDDIKGGDKTKTHITADNAEDWLVNTKETAKDKVNGYLDIVGNDTIDNMIDNEGVTEDDVSKIVDAGTAGLNDAKSAIQNKAEEKWAKAAQDDDDMMQSVNDAIDSSKQLSNNLSSTINQLTNDLAGVSEHYNKILGMIANALSGTYELTILNDISDQDTDSTKDGKVEGCRNVGTVNGDTNVGGIAGSMDTELDFDIEKILSASIDDTVELSSSKYYCRNILTDCINDGKVEGKKNDVGGVVGMNSIGNVLLSQNYGDVTGGGDYFGGVAGKSSSNIRKCFAMCALEGNSYIGGVVGQGKVIENCSTIVTADTAAACSGCIAGWVDFDNAGTSVKGNYFVNEELGGIDGISYSGVCERVTYEQLLTMNALPDEFRTLKLTFVADGETVQEIEFTYGDTLDESVIPAVPEKDGVGGVWEPFNYENLTRSATIEAQYNARQTVVASTKLRDGSPMSLVLVQGAFAQNTTLRLNEYSNVERLPLGGKSATTVVVEGTNPSESEYTMRWNTNGVHGKVYRLDENGHWKRLKAKQDGSYCVFTCVEKENTLCVIDSPIYFLIQNAVIALVALAVAFVVFAQLNKKYHFWKKPERAARFRKIAKKKTASVEE